MNVWVITDRITGDIVAVVDNGETAKKKIEYLERTCDFNTTFSAVMATVETLESVSAGLARLDLRKQALAKLTPDERRALDIYD